MIQLMIRQNVNLQVPNDPRNCLPFRRFFIMVFYPEHIKAGARAIYFFSGQVCHKERI